MLTARADRLRPDLTALGVGNGRHGFLVRNLTQHLPPGAHNVRVRRARDRLDIPGSPKSVIVPEQEERAGAQTFDVAGQFVTQAMADEVAAGGPAPLTEARDELLGHRNRS